MKKYFNEIGASMVIVTCAMVTILGFTALVTDIGLTMYEKEKLENAVDSAALAAMQDVYVSEQAMINSAKQYAELNGVDINSLNITINADGKGIAIKSTKKINYFFARALGITGGTIEARSKAKIAPITSYKGIRPLTIANQVLQYGKQYILKEDAGDGYSGNYGALALGGNGASVYRDNLYYGYKSNMKLGDIVFTETGNISETTRQGIQSLINQDPNSSYNNFQKDSGRIIIIPIVNTLDVNGKKPIVIVGFASFFLEGLSGDGGHTEIIGRFVRYISTGDSSDSQTDYGLKAIKLVN